MTNIAGIKLIVVTVNTFLDHNMSVLKGDLCLPLCSYCMPQS